MNLPLQQAADEPEEVNEERFYCATCKKDIVFDKMKR